MARLAKYVVEYPDKSQKKTVHHRHKSTWGQMVKEGETLKKKGARKGAQQGRECTTAAFSTESDGEFLTLGTTVSTVLPTSKPQPQPWPPSCPIQKNVSIAQHPAIKNTLEQPSTGILMNKNNEKQEAMSFGQLQQRN